MLLPSGHYLMVPYAVHMWDQLSRYRDSGDAGPNSGSRFFEAWSAPYKAAACLLVPRDGRRRLHGCLYRRIPAGAGRGDLGCRRPRRIHHLLLFPGWLAPPARSTHSSPTITPTTTCCATSRCTNLENVIPVKKALAGETGTALFSMDGTLGAGLTDFTRYADKRQVREVETISFADACRQFEAPCSCQNGYRRRRGARRCRCSVRSERKPDPIRYRDRTSRPPRIHFGPHHPHALRHRLLGAGPNSMSGQHFTWAGPSQLEVPCEPPATRGAPN